MSDPFRLDGKVALVTGANTGIGQAIAIGFARAGAEVIAAGRSSLDQTLDLIAAEGREPDAWESLELRCAIDAFEQQLYATLLVFVAGFLGGLLGFHK